MALRAPRAPICAGVAAAAALLPAEAGLAATLHVRVVDDREHPVEHVVVYAVPAASGTAAASGEAAAPGAAIMDQAHNQFVPHILVVQTGTPVLFPNNDVVSHHVYSFSEAKTFELGLYKGNAHPPLVFDKPGEVVLGCNIHDGMLGYIFVVDTPYFASTGADGGVDLGALPAGDYTVRVWTPRARRADLPAARPLALGADDASLTFALTGKLAPEHDQSASSLSWDRY